jgi:PAS domain S-box-containing protein
MLQMEELTEYEKIKTENKALLAQIAVQQKEAEELKKYKFFFDTGYNLATIASFEGYFEVINAQFEQVLGYSQKELLSNKFFSFVHPDDLADTIKEIETLKSGVTTFTFTNRYRKKNGDYLWLEWISSIPDVATGKIYAIARDITARKKHEAELSHKSEELAVANKELEQFAYVASHDLQEPLRTISNYINLLQEEYNNPLNENLAHYFKFIIQATAKMQNLIKDLLDFSRIGNMVAFAPVNCNNLLQEVMAELELVIKEANASIHVADLPVLIGNEIGFKQLFQNLISNAIKFRKKNVAPEVYISVEESNIEFCFAFKDNGIGIDEQFKDRIFIIFQRLHTADEYPGTGIGLANCNKIVALHHGKIWVASKPGYGSTFFFTISKKIEPTIV